MNTKAVSAEPATGCIIVLYNKVCDCISSLQTLLHDCSGVLQFCVADNSTDGAIKGKNEAWCFQHHVLYIDMAGNKGLSKAYNRALNLVASQWGWIVLLDDDTLITTEYFKQLNQYRVMYPETDIFLPLVYDQKGLLSPCLIRHGRFTRLTRRDLDRSVLRHGPGRLSAINSGLAIKAACFKDYRYDEHLFLDCIDHLFLSEMKTAKAQINLLDIHLQHDFADNLANKDEALKRFKIYACDYQYFCSKIDLPRLYCRFLLICRAIKLSLKYKNVTFISVLRGCKSPGQLLRG